jgi:hypothetical protein
MTDPTLAAELDCEDVVEVVTVYLEGVMSAGGSTGTLAACEGCRDYLEADGGRHRRRRPADRGGSPAGDDDRLLRAFRDWRR